MKALERAGTERRGVANRMCAGDRPVELEIATSDGSTEGSRFGGNFDPFARQDW